MDSIQSQTSKWWGAGLSVMDVFKMRNGRTLLLDLRYIHWNKGYNLSGQLLIRKALHLGQCYRNDFQCLQLGRLFRRSLWWEEPGAVQAHLPPRHAAAHWQTSGREGWPQQTGFQPPQRPDMDVFFKEERSNEHFFVNYTQQKLNIKWLKQLIL